MEKVPFQNMLVQRIKIAVLPLDLPCSGIVTHSGEILTSGKSHKKNLDGLYLMKGGLINQVHKGAG
jgi:hypothetical protein